MEDATDLVEGLAKAAGTTHIAFTLSSLLEYQVVSLINYKPINDTTFELSVFWPSDTESRINELRFSESVSLSFKTRLTSFTCFCGDVV